MTIIYQYRVANARLGTFVKLLAMWKGSVYKLLYKELLIFGVIYATISLIYRLALSNYQREIFEKIAEYCNSYTSLIPVSLVLGFYVSAIATRWWKQFMNVPWPDRTLFMMCCYLQGSDDRGRIIRRSVARYMLFGLILICRSISVAVMKRFPTLDHIVEAGFITKDEAISYENVECKYNKFWVPLMWANSILVQSRKEERIESDWGLRMVIEQLADYRDKCSQCFVYDWITIPLVYTQVVTLAVYTFFAACLIGRQFLDPLKEIPGYEYDLYVPVFTLLQFFFYVGWLKVAEQLINPFGEDDDDFDINWLIDRHMAVAMTLVDQMYGKHPPLVKDIYFNEVVSDLPYTEASLQSKKPIFLGSTYNLTVPTFQEQRFVPTEELRRRSSGSTFAGSMLSLFTGGRQSHLRPHFRDSHDLLYPNVHEKVRRLHDHNEYYQIPNGRFIHNGMDTPERRISTESTNYRPKRISSWMSDSDLETGDIDTYRRDRSHTDAGERLIKTDKRTRKRKISFPLSLLRRLAKDSRRHSHSSDSIKGRTDGIKIPREDVMDIPEYVPLRRAALIPDDKRTPPVLKPISVERQRKVSFPLSLTKGLSDDLDTGSTSSVPDAIAFHSKPSRFTVEHVNDADSEDVGNPYRRNAQKLEKAMAGHAVSRAPLLSAIEEGNTITSMSQIIPSEDESEEEGENVMKHDNHIPEVDEEIIKHKESTDEPKRMFIIPTITVDEW